MLDVNLKWFDFKGEEKRKDYKVVLPFWRVSLEKNVVFTLLKKSREHFLRACCKAQCKRNGEEVPILRDAFPVPLQMWSNPRKVGICMFSAETFLIPVAGNYPSAFTMDKAPSHMAPQGGRGGCWPSPASDSCHWSVLSSNGYFGEQTWSGECVPNHSRAGRCGWAWQGMLEYRIVQAGVENGTVSGGERIPRVREKHGMALYKKDTPGQVCL